AEVCRLIPQKHCCALAECFGVLLFCNSFGDDGIRIITESRKVIATTLRTVKTATVNDWSAICYADGKVHKGLELPGLEILDRVGGGDSFASGLIYGLMTTEDAQTAVNYGVAHGALAMTTPGDTSMASLKEVENIVKGSGARVQR
ncbi:MAG: hypothetical protein IIV47_03550, partial [Clostridia bacterium]|nr:hypothetical protein [Clostridia bacterium]